MKRLLLCLSLLLILLFVTGCKTEKNSKKETKYVNLDLAYNPTDAVEMYDTFDYIYVGKITKHLKTEHTSDNDGFNPISYYEVEVRESIKGKVAEKITVKFYGGYDKDGSLVLVNGGILPVIDSYYLIFANKQSDDFMLNNSLAFYLLENYDIDNPMFNQKQNFLSTIQNIIIE